MSRKRFSLVTMDMQMPGMNGDEATRTACEAGYTGRIALVSGNTFARDKEQALLALGITAFLTKMGKPDIRGALHRLAALKQRGRGGGGGGGGDGGGEGKATSGRQGDTGGERGPTPPLPPAGQ